jgi:hypothetical protein
MEMLTGYLRIKLKGFAFLKLARCYLFICAGNLPLSSLLVSEVNLAFDEKYAEEVLKKAEVSAGT